MPRPARPARSPAAGRGRDSRTASSSTSRSAWGSPASERRDGTPLWRRFLRNRVASETSTATSSLGSSLALTSSSSSSATLVVPAPDDFYAEARRQFAAYLENPCVHGLQYIARSDYPVAVRVLWALLFVSSVVGFVALAYLQAFSSTSMTRISVLNTRVPLEEYPFPSVTLCPFHQILKNPALALLRANVNLSSSRAANATPDDAMYLRMMSALQNFRYPQFSADWGKLDVEALESLGSMDAREFLVKVFPPCQIIFKSCRWLNVVVDCCTIFDLQETHNGLCYAFNSCTSRAFKDKECAPRNGSSEKGGGLMVITHFTMPTEVVDTSVVSAFSVVVGNPFEVPQPVGGFFIREDVSISRIEASLSVQLAEPDIAYLPWEARNCMFLDEQPLSIARPYTQQTCIEDCRLQLIRERCGCTPHYFSRSPDQGGVGAYEKSCNATGMQCIFENKSTLRRTNSVPVRNKRELDGLRLLDNDTGYDCTCPSECQILMYRTEITNLGTFKGSPVYDDNDTATTIFVRQRNMEARNIVYLKSLHRTFSEFVADLGNIAALFLGVSILSVFEFGFVSVSCLKTLYEGLKASKI